MGNTIRITGRMADALLHTARTQDGQTVRLSLNILAGTVVALMDRGLVEYNKELARENGYPVHTFTQRGVAAREQLIRENWGANPKTFKLDDLDREPEPVVEYSVKIWYRSGAYEGVAHSPEDLARKIFADAVKSTGVEFAELHGPSGKLVESKVPDSLTTAP